MKQMKFDFVCKDCGALQEPKDQTGHWDVFSATCTKCNGKLQLKMK